MKSNECTYIREQYSEYQENALSQNLKAKVEAHIAVCSSCQKVFTELSQVLSNLHQLERLNTSPAFTKNLMYKVHQVEEQSRFRTFLSSGYAKAAGYAIAAGLVAALGLNVLIQPLSPSANPGANSFSEEEKLPAAAERFAAQSADSLKGNTDSLEFNRTSIQTETKSVQLVSGTK